MLVELMKSPIFEDPAGALETGQSPRKTTRISRRTFIFIHRQQEVEKIPPELEDDGVAVQPAFTGRFRTIKPSDVK
jgi:hypothetical protein